MGAGGFLDITDKTKVEELPLVAPETTLTLNEGVEVIPLLS